MRLASAELVMSLTALVHFLICTLYIIYYVCKSVIWRFYFGQFQRFQYKFTYHSQQGILYMTVPHYFIYLAFSKSLSTTVSILSSVTIDSSYSSSACTSSNIIRQPLPWSSVPSNFLSRIISESLQEIKGSGKGCVLLLDNIRWEADRHCDVVDLHSGVGLDHLVEILLHQVVPHFSEVSRNVLILGYL